MLWEWIFGIPVYPQAPVMQLLVFDCLFMILFIFAISILGYMMIKMRPWKTIINSSGGTLGIFIDAGHRAHFVNFKNKQQYTILKDWGFRSMHPEGIYRATKQNCNIGIWSSRIAVPLPVHLAPVAQTVKEPNKTMVDTLIDKYGPIESFGFQGQEEPPLTADDIEDKDGEKEKKRGRLGFLKRGTPKEMHQEQMVSQAQQRPKIKDYAKAVPDSYSDNSSGAPLANNFYQFLVDRWELWIGTSMSPVLYHIQTDDMARAYAKLKHEYEEEKGFKFDYKILAIAGLVIIIIGVVLVLFL